MRRCAMRIVQMVAVAVAVTASPALSDGVADASGRAVPFAHESPVAIVTAAVSAARRSGSVHLIDVSRSGALSQVQTADLSGAASQASLTIGGKLSLQVIQKGTVIYLRANPSVLQHVLGLSPNTAASAAGKWVSVNEGDPPFATIASSLGVGQALGPYIATGDAHVGRSRRLGGRTVIPVSGLPSAKVRSGAEGTATLYVSASSPHVPVGGTLVLRQGHTSSTETAAFTRWGGLVTVHAPSARAYRTLAQG